MKVSIIIALAAAGSIAVTVTGCRTEESYRKERKEKTVEITVELSNISNHCYFCENKLQNGINKFTVSLDI